MAEPRLDQMRVAIVVSNDFEESELLEPKKALDNAGAITTVISPKGGEVQAVKHDEKTKKVKVDKLLSDADPNQFDAVLLPGGALNADFLRIEPKAQQFIREADHAKKPMAVICHAPWLLVSAGLVKGRTLTSYHTIQDDIRNAGGNWRDEEVVRDGNWVTSRQPSDIPAFNREMLQLFSEHRPQSRAARV